MVLDAIGAIYQVSAMPPHRDWPRIVLPFTLRALLLLTSFLFHFIISPYSIHLCSLHVQLQDGKFDKADRLFRSVAEAWQSCTSNPSDVKELVPELFYLPEVLLNNNNVDLGVCQTGERVGDVELPPWAKDAHDFVFQHRLALESDYVSANLHHWIDLVFGSKQRPPHISGGGKGAVDACNVFFHLTYSDAVNLDQLRLTDPVLYEQYQCQIAEFGQSPAQLFLEDHEPRKTFYNTDIFWPLASCVLGCDTVGVEQRGSGSNQNHNQRVDEEEVGHRPHRTYTYRPMSLASSPVVFLTESVSNDKLISIDSLLVVGQHLWKKESPDLVPPFKFRADGPALDASEDARATHNLNGNTPSGPSTGIFTSAGGGANSSASSSSSKGMLSSGFGMLSSISSGIGSMVRSSSSRDTSSRKGSISGTSSSRRRGGGGMLESMGITSPSSNIVSVGVPLCASFYRDSADESVTNGDMSGGTKQPLLSPTSTFSFFGKKNTTVAGASTNPAGDTAPGRSRVSKRTIEDREEKKKTSSFQSLKCTDDGLNSVSKSVPPAMLTAREPHVSSQLFSVIDGGDDGRYLFSCGHWDQSLRITNLDSGKLLHAARQHRDIVTCLATVEDRCQWWLITGSRDCSVQVWELFSHVLPGNYTVPTPGAAAADGIFDMTFGGDKKGRENMTLDEEEGGGGRGRQGTAAVDGSTSHTTASNREKRPLQSFPLHILYGHDDCVTCVAANAQLDIVVSGSDDGTVMVHSLRKGEYIRSITQRRPDNSHTTAQNESASIDWVGISQAGYIVTYCRTDCSICSYTLNGTFLSRMKTGEALYALTLSEDGLVLLTGGENCLVVMRWVRSLELASDGPRQGLESVIDGSLKTPGEKGSEGYSSVISNAAASISGNSGGGSGRSLVIAPFLSPIRSIYLTANERHLLVGDDDGYVRVITQDSNYLRERLEVKLIEYGILDM